MKNWEKKKLSELCDLITKGTTPTSIGYKFTDEGINFIKVESLTESGEIIPNKVAYIDEECHNALKRSQLKTNDILFSIAGALGRIGIVRDEIVPANTNQALAIIRLKNDSGVLVNYLAKYFNSNLIADEIEKLRGGAAQQNLSLTQLNELEIPLPPLPEQQRIVAILDAAGAAIAKAKANAEKNLKNTKELFESYLQGVFENKGEDWEEKTLGEVCEISSKLIDPKKSEFQNMIHIGAGNIESQKGTLIDLKTAKEENLISGKFLFDESMILYSKIRPYLMKVVNCEFQGLCSADIYPLLPFKGKMIKDYLYHLLLTKNFTDYAILGSQRAGMPKVNREHLFVYRFYLPSAKEQQSIVQKLSALSAETKKLESIYQQKISDLEELKKSVLQKAFSGELKTATAVAA